MRNPYLTTEIVIGRDTNIIKSEPVHGQMTFQDNVVTTPVTLNDLLGSSGSSSQMILAEVAAVSGNLQSQINTINDEIANISSGMVAPYVTQVNDISGSINIVNGNGIDIITLPNGQITISLYEAIDITSFTGGSTNEIGSTVNSVSLNWNLNKTETTQSINQGIGSLTVGVRTYNYLTPITTNTTFTLTTGDGTTSDNSSTSVTFLPRRWWGTDPRTTLAPAEIMELDSNELSSSRAKSFVINGGGEYIYYAYPASYGAATFTVNGLLNTAWTLDVVSHTNASGYTQNYNVYRTNTVQNGTGISIVVS